METVDTTTPIRFQVLPTDPSPGATYEGPICVDEFLDSDLETENPLHKEHMSSVTVATESVKTESAATESVETESAAIDSVSEEAQIASFDENNQSDCDSYSIDGDVPRDLTEEVVFVASEAPDDCDYSRGACGACVVLEKNNSDYDTTKIDDSIYDNKGDVVSEENDGSSHRGSHNGASIRARQATEQPEAEAQEWTYDDHYSGAVVRKEHQRQLDRKQRRSERYEQAERKRISKLMWFGVFLLLLEVAGASIAVMNYQELVECCGRSIFSENEAVGERWNKVFFYIGIFYLPVIILIEIPTLIIAQETLFLFNPMVGYLLVMQMLYATDTKNAYIIFGLESVAMLGQSIILVQMQRSPESCIHSVLNYTLAGITIYLLIMLTQQGGYCIVNDRIQSVFSESTCNIACIDEDSCFRCTVGEGDDASLTQCFIRFPES
jgi:hypothetical protein